MSWFKALSKLPLQTIIAMKQPISWLHSSPVLYAEPLKKKKKLDPQIIKHREERRKKKLEKQIRRLERNARQLKPVEELEVPMDLIDDMKQRSRNLAALTEKELEYRANLNNIWCRYKNEKKLNDLQIIDRLMISQQKALEELRFESEELYREAIQPDVTLLPIAVRGPVATPQITDYNSPDGEYILEIKQWDK